MSLEGDPNLIDPGFDAPPEHPLDLLGAWFAEAVRVGVREPYGLTLATVDAAGRASSRVVAVKRCDRTGLVFGTSAASAKARDLAANPWAAGNLWWRETLQQVSCGGRVRRETDALSDALFLRRPPEARAVASVSTQSATLESEAELRAAYQEALVSERPIERPAAWGAYRLVPERIEFWHGRPDRFHRRLLYELVDGTWLRRRLQP